MAKTAREARQNQDASEYDADFDRTVEAPAKFVIQSDTISARSRTGSTILPGNQIIDLSSLQRRKQNAVCAQISQAPTLNEPSQAVIDIVRGGFADIGPLSPDDCHVMIKVLSRLSEIERGEGLEAALLTARLIAQVFDQPVNVQ